MSAVIICWGTSGLIEFSQLLHPSDVARGRTDKLLFSGKCEGVTTIIRSHYQGFADVCTKLHDSSCSAISV